MKSLAIALLLLVPPAAGQSSVQPQVVPGLTGAAAQQAAGPAADHFLTLRRSQASSGLAAQLHTDWGVNFPNSASQGLHATQSVLATGTRTTTGGDYVYAPTAIPAGGACMEMTTAYTPSGPSLWAWDWCGGRDRVGKLTRMDSTFLSTYTTTVNGQSAYRVDIHRTNASNNTWTAYLFNVRTNVWDTYYTSSGTYDLPQFSFGWNMFEIYTTSGAYCSTFAGRRFESSSVEVFANNAWTPATPANSRPTHRTIPPGTAYDCPSLTFTLVHANDHWTAQVR
jgi:hypothetical protein